MRHLMFRALQRAFEGGLKRRPTFRYWESLERSQWLSRSELEAIQVSALKRLIKHAKTHCPFYRERWPEGCDTRTVHSLEDLRAFPVLLREHVKQHRLSLRSEIPGALIPKTTSGSSGVPLAFDLDPGSYSRRMAATFRGYNWAGAGPGAKTWHLWGDSLESRSLSERIRNRNYQRLYRRRVANCFELRDDTVPALVQSLSDYRPEAIVAYTGALYSFAVSIEEQGLRAWSPQAIVVGAEKLHSFQRDVISRVFRSPVFETYGCREFMLIGGECECHRGFHVTMEHLIVELLDDSWNPVVPGQEGNVVITDLYNYGMPFIRYVNGDRAVMSTQSCSCGRGLQLLDQISGRVLDVIATPDGRKLPGEFFPHLLKDFLSVRQFDVEQVAPDVLRIRLVLAPNAESETLRTVREAVIRAVGPTLQVIVDDVAFIPLTAAGKRQVVRHVAQS